MSRIQAHEPDLPDCPRAVAHRLAPDMGLQPRLGIWAKRHVWRGVSCTRDPAADEPIVMIEAIATAPAHVFEASLYVLAALGAALAAMSD
jgi:hypothetical protein